MTPRIFEAFVATDGDEIFDPAPQPEPDRLFTRLAARFGGMDLLLLRRLAVQESADAIRMFNRIDDHETHTP